MTWGEKGGTPVMHSSKHAHWVASVVVSEASSGNEIHEKMSKHYYKTKNFEIQKSRGVLRSGFLTAVCVTESNQSSLTEAMIRCKIFWMSAIRSIAAT
jgi:hypothetical protein